MNASKRPLLDCATQNILVQSTIRRFIELKVSEDSRTQASEKRVPVAPIRHM